MRPPRCLGMEINVLSSAFPNAHNAPVLVISSTVEIEASSPALYSDWKTISS
jgi:hypothetical protein